VAPANEELRDVVAVSPVLRSDRAGERYDAQLNVVQKMPWGFCVLNCDTLSGDPELRPINVRRLLMLLRRLAMKHGSRYVFEPHDDTFQRLVKSGFDNILGDLFVRGAFGGRTADTSFQVVTGEDLNTPARMDQGQFIVELRVRPSLPLSFLTIRLVQDGNRAVVSELH
jgi:phage tail sheath protein FI